MSTGLTVSVVGFGGQRSVAFKEACDKVVKVVSRLTKAYPMLSFLQAADDQDLYILDNRGKVLVDGVSKRLIALPPLRGLVYDWQNILEGISADLEGVIVTILVDGVIQAALNGEVLE